MWDSIDMICIENYHASFAAVVLKKKNNWIFKVPNGPAQSSIVPLKKRIVKPNYRANFEQVNVKWESRNNRKGTNNHWRRSKEVGFPEIALPKLVAVKSVLKSLKNNRKGAYFL